MSEDDPDREDPFDRLGPDAEREGDPFDRLGDERSDADEDAGEDEDVDPPVDDDPWVPPGEDRRDAAPDDVWNEADRPGTPDESTGAPRPAGDADPFANVDTPTESPFDDAGSVFERVEAGGADPDEVWESITGEGDDGEAAEPSVPEEGRYSDVSKHRFCEQCEQFSPPPDVSCGHHTAEIIEFLDMDTVRLLDCPVVAERETLEGRE